jgi:hypothetical protein
MAGSDLHVAAEQSSADVVLDLARRVTDVDAELDGRSALWQAVHAGKVENARALVEAGADPWRPMMAGWSPGRLALASSTPNLFGPPPEGQALSPAEAAAVQEAERLKAAVSEPEFDGMSICCVSGIDAAEALRRLEATAIELDEAEVMRLSDDAESDAALFTLGITDVPEGCVVAQPWAYGASMPAVAGQLSKGTVAYAMYANPKSGEQGSSFRDGVTEGADLSPGNGWSESTDSAEDILLNYLYQGLPFAYCCACAGVRPLDDRPWEGVPDLWVRLPVRDYWVYPD